LVGYYCIIKVYNIFFIGLFIGILITQEEETDDWAYMFSTLKSAIKNIFHVDYEPNILVADCAAEITNGFSEVFDLAKRVFCWAHVERAVEGHLPGKGDKEENGNKTERKLRREAILNDIRLFQKHTELDNWIPIARLLILKWKENKYPDEFINYFQNTYLKPNKIGFIDHFCNWVPCQTNAIESTNRYVKDNGTFRERLSVIDFLFVLEKGFARNWSTDRSKTLTRLIEGELKTEENKKYVPFMTEECESYFNERKAAKWDSFDKAVSHSIYFVTLNEMNWKLSRCSCYWWSKNYKCKHVIAVCFRSGLLHNYPDECKDVNVGWRRRRGRPVKNRGAFKRIDSEQVNDQEEDFSFSEEEEEEEKYLFFFFFLLLNYFILFI